jgi:hypothetical protein
VIIERLRYNVFNIEFNNLNFGFNELLPLRKKEKKLRGSKLLLSADGKPRRPKEFLRYLNQAKPRQCGMLPGLV